MFFSVKESYAQRLLKRKDGACFAAASVGGCRSFACPARWGDCQALLTIHLRAVGQRKAMMEKEEEAHQSAKRQKLAEEEKLRKELQDRSYRWV